MARPRARLIMQQRLALWLLLLVLLVPLTGCSVRLIQPYDEAIEKTVTDFYEEFLRFTTVVGRTRGHVRGQPGLLRQMAAQAYDSERARHDGQSRGTMPEHGDLRRIAPAGSDRDTVGGDAGGRPGGRAPGR